MGLTLMAMRYSSLLEPEPPWNTKKTGRVSQYRNSSWNVDCHTGLLLLATKLLRDIGLVLAKELGVKADIARGIHAVHVAVGNSSVQTMAQDR
jgi:hypothetical protein